MTFAGLRDWPRRPVHAVVSWNADLARLDVGSQRSTCLRALDLAVLAALGVDIVALALWMAQAAGFYDAQNLKVSITNMGGGSRGAEALRAGRLEVMHVGLSSVVQLNKAGGDLRTIASDDGSELRFAPEAERSRRDNLLLIRSDYRAPFGTFSGTLPGAIPIAQAFGVVEHHRARW